MARVRWGVLSTASIGRLVIEATRVAATRILDGDAGVDLRMAATLRLPGDVLAQFDVALDLTRRDELELVGTEGRLVVPDPWLCRAATVIEALYRSAELGTPVAVGSAG